MTDPVTRIVQVCVHLNSRAAALEEATAKPSSVLARAIYPGLEPEYRDLEALIRAPSSGAVAAVLKHPDIVDALPRLHALRAAYEYQQEMARARAVLETRSGAKRLEGLIAQERHWASGAELNQALETARQILVAGSGPLPLTALMLAQDPGRRITCAERDVDAHTTGRAVLALATGGGAIGTVNTDLADLTDLDRYDAIVGAVLLGVRPLGEAAASRPDLLRAVVARMKAGTRLIVREPHGLGLLLYPTADLQSGVGLEVSRHVPRTAPDRPYRSAVLVAWRTTEGGEHGGPSTL